MNESEKNIAGEKRKTPSERPGPFLSRFLLFSLIVPIIFSSCTPEKPEIYQKYWQILWAQNPRSDRGHEELSLFLQVGEDEKASPDSLAELYVIEDQSGLFWTIPSDRWILSRKPGALWIGVNGIRFQRELPRGRYRILLYDKAGRFKEESIYLSLKKDFFRGKPVPRAVRRGENYILDRRSPLYQIWTYRDSGTFVRSRYETPGLLKGKEFFSKEEEKFYLYTFSDRHSTGMRTGPYPTRPEPSER